MKVKKILIKTFLILSAFVVVLGVVEVVLHFFNRHYFGDQYKPTSKAGQEVDIICLGNSYTAGVGAPPGKSYCHQLQQLAEARGYKLNVENWAYPMQNTSQINQMLRQKLTDKNPKIALIMAGEPNYVNFKGVGEFAAKDGSWRSYKLIAMDFLHRHSGVFRLYTLLQGSPKPPLKVINLPFSVRNENDDLEVAYRWLAWGRTNVSAVRLTPEQVNLALAAADFIKARDPANRAVDFFKADVLIYGSNNLDKAIEVYRTVPKDQAACLAVLEYSKKKAISNPRHKKIEDFLAQIRQKWAEENSIENLAAFDKLVNFRADRDSFKDANATSVDRLLPHLLKMSECGTPGDGLTQFLVGYFRHHNDYGAELDMLEAHLKTFPMTEYIDVFGFLNPMSVLLRPENQVGDLESKAIKINPSGAGFLKSIVTNHKEWGKKIDQIRNDHIARFGNRVESAVELNTTTIQKWIEFDLNQMNEMLGAKGTKVIFMTYPPTRTVGKVLLPPQKVDSEIHNVAKNSKVQLFDTYNILRPIFLATSYNDVYYSSHYGPWDNHLNAAGYGVLAENLLNYLEQNNLIKKP